MPRLSLVLALLLAACAHLAPTSPPTPGAHGPLSERAKLGPLVSPAIPASDQSERLLKIAELEQKAGDDAAASRAMRQAFLAAFGYDRFALSFDPSARASARAALERATHACIAMGRAIESSELVVTCARGPIPGDRKVLEWARDSRSFASQAEKEWWRSILGEAPSNISAEGTASAAELAKRGRAGIEALNARLTHSPSQSVTLLWMVDAALALLPLDPMHVEARIWAQIAQEAKQGRLTLSEALVNQLADSTSTSDWVRVALEARKHPSAISLRLWLANRALRGNLVGDAKIASDALANNTQLVAEQRAIASTISALSQARWGELGPLEELMQAKASLESPYLWNKLAELDSRPTQAEKSRAAKRHIFQQDLPRYHWLSMEQLAADPELAPALRQTALEGSDRSRRRTLRHCIDRNLSFDACVEKLDAIDYLEEYEAGWEQVLALEPDAITPDWLGQLGPESDDLQAAQAFMERAKNAPLGQTGPYLRLALAMAIERGDTVEERRTLELLEPHLSVYERIGLALAAEDRKQGKATSVSELFWNDDIFDRVNKVEPADAELPSWLVRGDDTPEPTTYAAKFVYGVQLRGSGFVHPSLAQLLPLLPHVGGDAGSWLAYYVWDTARVADDAQAEERALKRLQDLNANSIWVQLAQNTKEAEACGLALRLVGQSGTSATCAKALPEKAPTLVEAWQAFEAAIAPHGLSAALQRAGVRLTRDEWIKLLEEDEATTLLTLDDARLGRALSDSDVVDALIAGLADLSPDDALARARRVAPMILRHKVATTEAAWIAWFAGHGKESERLAAQIQKGAFYVPFVLLSGSALRKDLPVAQAYRVLTVFALAPGSERPALARELSRLPATAATEGLRCQLLQEDEAQLKVCEHAWQLGSRDPKVATSYADALESSHLPARDAAVTAFLAQARDRFGDDLPGAAWRVEAGLHARLGRIEKAARATEQAWAADAGVSDESADLIQARERPLVSRIAAMRGHWGAEAYRVLAWMCLHDGNLAAAPLYLAAARSVAYSAESELDAKYLDTQDLLELARRDVSARNLDAAGLADVMVAHRGEQALSAMQRLKKRHPRSALRMFLEAELLVGSGDLKRALEQTRRVAERHGDLGVVAAQLARFLTLGGRYAEARAVLLSAEHQLPEDPRLAEIRVPAGVDMPNSGVLAVLTSAEGVLRAVRAVSQAEIDALSPRLETDADTSAELALPAHYGPASRFDLGGEHAGMTVGVKVMARASRCEPALCIAPINQQYEQMNLHVEWSDTAELPQGPVALSLARGPENVLLTVAFPIGERVYMVFVAGSETQLAQRAPEIALALLSFRPLDAVLAVGQAVALRGQADKEAPVADATRIRARMDALRPAKGCSLQTALASTDDEHGKAWLLLDVYLSTPTEAGRAAVVACASGARQRSELGLVTLWDESPSLHDQGAAFVRADSRAAVEQLKRILPVLEQRALAAASEKTEELPPHGVAEFLSAIRGPARHALALDLLTHASERVRRVTLAALSLDFDLPLTDELLRLAEASTTQDLPLWLDAAGGDPRMLPIARKRLDAIEALTPKTFYEAANLTDYLTSQLDPADGPRLTAVSRKALAMEDQFGPGFGTGWLRQLVRQYEVALGSAPGAADTDPLLLEAGARLLRAQRGDASSPGRVKSVLSGTLAEVLPGPSWSYFRVQQPGALLSELRRLYNRLGAEGNAQRPVALAMLSAMFEEAGSALLAESQGLDLERPIECAAPDLRPEAFVCSGYVKDRDALRKELGRRSFGQDDGVALLTHVARAAASTVDSVELAPGLVHDMQYGSKGGRPERPGVSVERMRSDVRIGDQTLELMTIIELKEDGGIVPDIELSLFGKDRWIVFSGRELARWVLSDQSTPALSSQAQYQRAMRELQPRAAIQAYIHASGDAQPLALELGPVDRGLQARIVATRDEPQVDLTLLSQPMPAGAVSSYATDKPARVLPTLRMLKPHRDAGSVPPFWLFSETRALAFGWYPTPGEALWAHWVAVAQLPAQPANEAVPETLRSLDAGQSAQWQGLHAARVDDRLIVATGAGLLRSALDQAARPPKAQANTTQRHGQVDATRVGRFMSQLGGGKGSLDQRAMGLRGIAALASIAGELSYRTSRKGPLETIELELRPELSARPQPGSPAEGPVTLADRNAIKVPKNVPESWLADGVVVRLRAKGSEAALLRAFLPSSRLATKALADGTVELSVSPGAAPGTPPAPAPRSPIQLLSLLGTDDMFRPNDAPIRELARKLGNGSSDVSRRVLSVLNWVGNNISYELQPSSNNATRILEQRRGDCSEFAVLTVSLLRSLGIAAEMRSGLVLSDGELVAHAWVAYYDGGGFREIDPTAGSMSVHAGYIEASVLDITALLSLGEIDVVDVTPRR